VIEADAKPGVLYEVPQPHVAKMCSSVEFKAKSINEYVQAAKDKGESWALDRSTCADKKDGKQNVEMENGGENREGEGEDARDEAASDGKTKERNDQFYFFYGFRDIQSEMKEEMRLSMLNDLTNEFKEKAVAIAKAVVDEKYLPLDSTQRTITPVTMVLEFAFVFF